MKMQPVPPPPFTVEPTPLVDRPQWRARDLIFGLLGGLGLSGLFGLVAGLVIAVVKLDGDYDAAAAGVIGIIIYASLALSMWFFAIKRKGLTLADAGFRSVTRRTMLLTIPVTFGLLFANFVMVGISAALFGEVPTAQDQVLGEAPTFSFSDLLWLLAVASIAAPIVEEFIFRGLVYPLMKPRFRVWGAVFLSSLLFAVVHFIPPLIPVFLMMGAILAVVFQRYDSLYPAIAVHMFNNTAALLALYATFGS